jgi:hypothetical protein
MDARTDSLPGWELLGAVCAEAFSLQEDGMLRCEAGSKPVAERASVKKMPLLKRCHLRRLPDGLPTL